jgi:demethylmenaquinone methyltransferase/2-methoxy-6-polyprenyl-1,4-benzoquinol methylase
MSAPTSHSAEPEKVQALFTRIAAGYDRFNGIASLGLDRLWRRRAVRLAAVPEGARVLDLAAGTGDLTAALAQQARPGLVVSSDFTAAMLVAGKAKLGGLGPPDLRERIAFSLADATRLPSPTRASTRSRSRSACATSPTGAPNYREVRRVLKAGGRYVVLELTHPGFAPFKPVYWLTCARSCRSSARAHRRRPGGLRVPARLHPGLPRRHYARGGDGRARVLQGRVREGCRWASWPSTWPPSET